jgi:N utilization substance protein B
MGVVDRSVLRLGTAEILYWPWIPDRVSIDEYVEIAKKYGTEHSGGFVNAILDRVSRDSETEESDAAAEGEPE